MLIIHLLLAAALAVASPTPSFKYKRQMNSTNVEQSEFPPLTQNLWINGERVSSVAAVNAPPQDIRDFAREKSANVPPPSNIDIPQQTYNLHGDNAAHLRLDYSTMVKSCKAPLPEVVHRLPLWPCTIDTCSEELTMANTITKTYRYGLELGAKAKVGADFKLISIELEGSITQDQEWVDSNVTAVTRKQTWTLKQGQICAPMTVQIKTECQSQINIASFAVYGKDGARKHPGIDNVCTYFASEAERDNYVRGQGIDAATVAQICTSTMPTNNEGRIVLDVNEPGLRFPQSYTGCGLS